MEKIAHQSRFTIAKFDEEKKLYTLTYLPETANMRDVEWKSLMEELLVLTDNLKPKYILDDNSDRLYAYSPEIQDWTLKLFLDTWIRNGLKKYVQILPKDFIGKLSAQQIIEMGNIRFSEVVESTFVASYEDAVKWLDI